MIYTRLKHFFTQYWIFFLLVCVIFALSLAPVTDFDAWFHIKSGELFWQHGLRFTDVFSYTANGRSWIPYEWLFQIIIFLITQVGNLWLVSLFVALLAAINGGIIYFIVRRLCLCSPLWAATLTFTFFGLTYEFITARPQLFGYIFTSLTLFCLLFLYQQNKNNTSLRKNLLLLVVPTITTLVWANSHGSVFLVLYFIAGFWMISRFIDHSSTRIFIALGVICAIATILPPLGLSGYKLLFMFFQQRELIGKFIEEWGPLSANQPVLLFVSTTIIVGLGISTVLLLQQRRLRQSSWLLILVPLIFGVYGAIRNSYFTYFALILILAWATGPIVHAKQARSWILSILLVAASLYLISEKKIHDKLYYPTKAAEFIKEQGIVGNMFNEYGYGGYLLYHLYPDQKVFIDGRTDIYLCCEMPATLELSYKKNLPDNEYQAFLDEAFWNKYIISFVILRTQKHAVVRKIASILTDDPAWVLVFWDDNAQIFVRRDGKNDTIIERFGATAATPYERSPIRDQQEDQALGEYQDMIAVADSSKSRNAIGYILLHKENLAGAQEEFEKAVALDPTHESPYMNLAELAASRGQEEQAIALYQKARSLAPDRGLIYIRLGKLTIRSTNDYKTARSIWQEGLSKTIDTDAKNTLRTLLEASGSN